MSVYNVTRDENRAPSAPACDGNALRRVRGVTPVAHSPGVGRGASGAAPFGLIGVDGAIVTDRTAAAQAPARILYVDGLRGLAVAMVVAFHAWRYAIPGVDRSAVPPTTLADAIVGRGFQGVSLFLVLSGFCLSYPLLRRRQAGMGAWLRPSEFFARRCLRILPPYYAALALFTAISLFLAERRIHLNSVGWSPRRLDLATHLLLIHNLWRPATYTINGSYWSLALEWQWYWLFPLVLVLSLRLGAAVPLVCLAMSMAWNRWFSGVWSEGALPLHLFEFCCGIVAARCVVERRRCRPQLLAIALLATILAAEAPATHPLVLRLGLYESLWGVAFGALLLLGNESRLLGRALSWGPLVGLGTISYSLYLLHEPLIEAIETFTPVLAHHPLPVAFLAIACSALAGSIFHLAIERPCMSRATWDRVAPLLTRALRWTDGIEPAFGRLSGALRRGARGAIRAD